MAKVRTPDTREELLARYALGERAFGGIEFDLKIADLSGARLDGCDFSMSWWDTSFRGTSLRNACFHRANVKCCDFSGADLTDADFTEALLDGATFSGACLLGARFGGASVHSHVLRDDEVPHW